MKDPEWEWPCPRHEAHGPHHIDWVGDCPGVKAHPLTQIGKGELKPKS